MASTTTVENSTIAAEPRSERQTNLRALLLALLAALLFAWWWFELRETPAPSPGIATPTPTVTIGPGSDFTPTPADEPSARVAAKSKSTVKPTSRIPAITTAQPIAGNPMPKYPPVALRRNESGTVLLRVSIGSNGTPTDINIAQRSGSRDLDRAAMSAVRKWQFRPATRNGLPVASTVEVPVEFRPTSLASL